MIIHTVNITINDVAKLANFYSLWYHLYAQEKDEVREREERVYIYFQLLQIFIVYRITVKQFHFNGASLTDLSYFRTLSRWVQAECRRLGDTDNSEVGELLKTAVRCLKERPVLFKYCAEEVIVM